MSDSQSLPSGVLPNGACDTHFHIYEDRARFPTHHASPLYDPPLATTDTLLAVHRALGIERGVVVHTHNYGLDFSMLYAFFERAPAGAYRGIVIVNDGVDDRTLAKLHDAGVRGARFLFQERYGSTTSIEEFRRSVARIGELGWITKVFPRGSQFLELEEELKKIRTPVLIDHMGRFDFAAGVNQPAVEAALRLLRQENVWMSLSNGNVREEGPTEPWSDAVPFGRKYFEIAPDRCIWGSDWPNISHLRRGLTPSSTASLLGLLRRYLPDDQALQAVLSDNPARLYGFQ